ncbi:MAG: flagellar M-ring protein FliF [Rhodobacteraceae bacterium PARR1]|nr:MAG: flagellar M-ring protein FliF [Rhodobacteraceae bacterium PARR1]
MQNLVTLWNTLDNRRRMIVAGATVAVFAAVLVLSRMAATPQMALLYSGLDPAAAGAVVAALEARGVAHQVQADAIQVPADRRDSLRMELAAEGLPAATGKGYELLDALSGFGTTAQMFDAAQWRAIEGELARTLLASPGIRAARVHISRGAARAFAQADSPTASVAVTPSLGPVTGPQAQAIRHLVAAAVAGLTPDQVQVIDTTTGLVQAEDATMPAAASARAAEIRGNVERLLAARVGPGRAVVEVAVDLVTESETISERKIDPDGRVVVSSASEQQSGSQSQPGGAVTVASNLPDQAGAGQGAGSSNETARETVNYELSETRRDLRREPGDIRRLSVAVLVDAADGLAEDGTPARTPRSEEEMAVLRDLVASAVGLDEARGDVLTLRSLEFLPTAEQGALAEAGLLSGPLNLMQLVQMAVLAGVALVLGLFVLRPILTAPPRALPAPPLALAGMGIGSADALTGVIDDDAPLPPMALVGDFPVDEDPVARLRRLINERQAESVEILRGWMEAEERT